MRDVQLQSGCAALHRAATERPRIGAMRAMQRPVQPGTPIRSAGQHRTLHQRSFQRLQSEKIFPLRGIFPIFRFGTPPMRGRYRQAEKMKNLSNYIQSLNFEYAISYSGLRGEKFLNLEVENKKEIKRIEKEIESARFMQKPKLNAKIEDLKSEINLSNSRVINKKGDFHKSTEVVYKFEKDDKEIKSIFKILTSKFEEQVVAACAPILRDSIAFYSKQDEIVGILQMCFTCWSIKNEKEEYFEVDHKIFPILKDKLIQIGHPIEN